MDPSHWVVGGLTLVTGALLVWIELRSRRHTAQQQNKNTPAHTPGSTDPDRTG